MVGEMEVHTTAYQGIDKMVKPIGNSGGILVRKIWTGKRVKNLLLDPIEAEKATITLTPPPRGTVQGFQPAGR